ncbi:MULTISPECIES: GNAT family N-acetyltransferase [Niastella]|uniref:GNAT family N-acetyltransferase n=1 Tax=Niastella soli TaxID=2821487 RepID=A0ABS3YU46_9BACT|nr:GNAT family N-acetyltransferase [Niastella soli]MBO9201393.1 GNAT family N-acetyltransferase [Niastella soli]
MNCIMPLYASLAPDNKYDPVFERQLAHGVTIALRPLSLPNDWPFIVKWLHRAFGRFSPAAYLPDKHLRETFSIMLQCDFAQPFVGLINDQPVFLVELCDGDKQCDEWEPGTHIFEPGDHSMRLLLSHAVMHTRYWSEYALFSCLDYFFSHPQVKRIVWQLHEKDKYYISLANQAGVIHSRASAVQVFLYLRENFTCFLSTYHRHMQKLS